jgi:hypothetical protein
MNQLRLIVIVPIFIAALTCVVAGNSATPRQTANSHPSSADSSQMTPVMDGGAGPCSLELSVTSDGKPAVATNVKVHIAYGFAGTRKLDLDAYTGNDGKLKFTGLPERVKRPPLKFRASKDKLAGTAVYDPETECHAKLDVVLSPQKSEE